MPITTLRGGHAQALYRVYRDQTDRLPHALVPSLERFEADLERFGRDSIMVAADGRGRARGFAASRVVKDHEETEGRALTGLFFDEEETGRELVEAWLQRSPERPVLAFPRDHGVAPVRGYNGGWSGLSDRMPAAARLLARAGLRPYYRELNLTCDLTRFPPPSARAPDGVAVDLGEEGGLQARRATADGQHVGVCAYMTSMAAMSDDPRAERTGYIEWLWVAEGQRRRGLGRVLLAQALADLARSGCAAAWLTTGADNWRAQPLYLSLGFEVVDAATSFRALPPP